MAGYDPNQPRNEDGEWTIAGNAAREAAGLESASETPKTGDKRVVFAALQKLYGEDNVMIGKGSDFYIRGKPTMSLSQARKLTGIAPATTRTQGGETLAWGELGWVAGINHRMRG